jgi:hypothetical protein
MIQAWLLKNAALVAVSAVVLGSALWVGHSLKEAGRNEIRPILDKTLAERDNLASQLESERAERQKAEEATSAYSKELASIRRRVSGEPVRVCFDETSAVSAASGTASNSDAAASQAGSVSGAARGDLAALRELAYQCDAVSARLRALQSWAQPSP